ncbi:MAG: DNA primase, partial [Thermoproteota archaeon]|nr:DNA primase [Thermoproteota archaeon]
MDYVDDKYIRLLSTRLDKYKHVKSGLYNFRCPYCGDSQKHKNKARGYFFLKKTEYIYKCHNCGIGRSLSNFLKDNAVDLHDQYVMEKYKQGMTGKGRHTPSPEYKGATPKFAKKVTDCTPISELNTGHPAKEYLLKRKIPEDQLGRFFYVDKFKRW